MQKGRVIVTAHAFTIKPDFYQAFENEEEQIAQCKEWGLLSDKASKTKAFFYKAGGANLECKIVGFVDKLTAVIEFENGQRHCIHPSYLKEMQAANYGQRFSALAEEISAEGTSDSKNAGDIADSDNSSNAKAEVREDSRPVEEVQFEELAPIADKVVSEKASDNEDSEGQAVDIFGNVENEAEAPPVKPKTKKEKKQKLQLPEEKVKMTATVKEFTSVPNHFTESEDEVIIYEQVSIVESELEIGDAWSSYSATLKKLELEVGDILTFDAKVIPKKLTKHPVPYKINNPSKIQKAEE
ncbi:hypothetical protein ACFOQM_00780 [Paenibacillus sp. GCM10012307]|uniref:Uncharacterized protein n=1 Tax=Paenibacillus roseus TaxID=2798579 RepID=A0A934J3X8_9BACL|nr:hypothetical protein [Paenibacillus roseus]MBJ6359857.1 hypothetical protein [Paenibacillus roseus]